ncbi:acetyltransferase [Plebeiibacterium marinum]|uniref:Acetyltransferase n=1 Tax=Plebeiibacterium marinum TaxID=2992111 RepID=A0AAE3MDM3_9BACT|nr:acetyltransferase [Plebeiobacterium marinum]MCW3805804.1 acetyltransferase [Plebeiobacterium marinum]
MDRIILVGGGGHCKSCIDVIEQEGKYKIEGIVDPNEEVGHKILGYPVLGSDDDLPKLIDKFKNVLITVGQIKSAGLRIKLYKLAKSLGAEFPVIVSPNAYVSTYAKIEEGTIVMHHVVVNSEAQIGINNIINTKALVEHEVQIGDHNHISTGTRINGQVKIADECFIGSGATLANNIILTEKVIVPAGKTVYKDIVKSGIYINKKK